MKAVQAVMAVHIEKSATTLNITKFTWKWSNY